MANFDGDASPRLIVPTLRSDPKEQDPHGQVSPDGRVACRTGSYHCINVAEQPIAAPGLFAVEVICPDDNNWGGHLEVGLLSTKRALPTAAQRGGISESPRLVQHGIKQVAAPSTGQPPTVKCGCIGFVVVGKKSCMHFRVGDPNMDWVSGGSGTCTARGRVKFAALLGATWQLPKGCMHYPFFNLYGRTCAARVLTFRDLAREGALLRSLGLTQPDSEHPDAILDRNSVTVPGHTSPDLDKCVERRAYALDRLRGVIAAAQGAHRPEGSAEIDWHALPDSYTTALNTAPRGSIDAADIDLYLRWALPVQLFLTTAEAAAATQVATCALYDQLVDSAEAEQTPTEAAITDHHSAELSRLSHLPSEDGSDLARNKRTLQLGLHRRAVWIRSLLRGDNRLTRWTARRSIVLWRKAARPGGAAARRRWRERLLEAERPQARAPAMVVERAPEPADGAPAPKLETAAAARPAEQKKEKGGASRRGFCAVQ